MIAADIVVALFMQGITEIHVVKSNLKFLGKSTNVHVLLPANKKAGAGNTYGVMDSSVIAKIVALVVMHLL